VHPKRCYDLGPMTTLSVPISASRYGPPPARARRFTVDEYHRMIEDGYFAADEHFELLDGWIVEKVARNPPHDSVLNRARRRIERALPAGWMVRVQSAITTATSEPEPDIAVVRGDDKDYEQRHPGPADAALVVEVSNTTIADDRSTKLRAYAAAGVELYWILNVDQRTVEVYERPTGPAAAPAYRSSQVLSQGQSVTFTAGGVLVGPIPVADLLG
jgi:Uma2 family endonuclease